MSADKPAAVIGATRTVRTYVDGSLVIQIEIEPRNAQAAFALFGSPGTPVALARLEDAAANAHEQNELVAQAEAGNGDYGRHYQTLYRHGWFYNPRVQQAFKCALTGADSVDVIKQRIYEEMNVTSLAQLPPSDFVQMLQAMGIADTLPRDFVCQP